LAIAISESHTVDTDHESIRIQDYGPGIFTSAFTKSALKKALKKGLIFVNGVSATSATFVKNGDLIEYKVEDNPSPQKAFRLHLSVLYQDDHIAVVHKPAGLLVSGNSFKTLANALEANLKPSAAADAVKPQPAHRIDFATTGTVLIGKTASALRNLNAAFEEKTIQKKYLAVTPGSMPMQGLIDSEVDGKRAESHFRVVQSVPSERFGQLNLLSLEPKTGRRHQLRIHLAEKGHAILGDRDYSSKEGLLKGKGMYLHAYSLAFDHPNSGEQIQVVDPQIERFLKIFPDCLEYL